MIQLGLQHKIEELHCVLERARAAIVQIERTVPDAAECKCFDGPSEGSLPNQLQVVILLIQIETLADGRMRISPCPKRRSSPRTSDRVL